MNLVDAIKIILKNGQMEIPAIRDIIWDKYPKLRKKDRNTTRNAIYNIVKEKDDFIFYETEPRSASLADFDSAIVGEKDEVLEDYKKEKGIIYILKTSICTKNAEEIIKIGFTTQPIEKRIEQLYTTGSPYRFTIFKTYEVKNYIELEKALHKLLKPFQVNPEREFFTDKSLKYIDNIVELHNKILNES